MDQQAKTQLDRIEAKLDAIIEAMCYQGPAPSALDALHAVQAA
jgi:hypothetical protein